MMKAVFRSFLPLFYLVVLVIPGYIFFTVRGGFGFLEQADFKTANLLLFPLVGLYAFTFVFFQVVFGSSMRLLIRVYPAFLSFHRRHGLFTLLFALTHPVMRILGISLAAVLKNPAFGISHKMSFFYWLGYFQLFLLLLTVIAALLRSRPWLVKYWRKIHYLNYLIFISVWLHSWFLGSDIQTTNFKWLWIFFAVAAGASVLLKYLTLPRIPVAPDTPKVLPIQ